MKGQKLNVPEANMDLFQWKEVLVVRRTEKAYYHAGGLVPLSVFA